MTKGELHKRPASARTVLLVFCGFVLVATLASDAALVRSRSFWSFCAARAHSMATRPLALEAELRLLEPGDAAVVVLGSSVVPYAVSPSLLADELELDEDEVRLVHMAGATALELCMLAPELERLRPRVVVYLATPWLLLREVDWDDVRLYDPGVALELFGWGELFAEREHHASLLLGSLNVVLRHRAALRGILFDPSAHAEAQVLELESRERRGAELADFGSPNASTRALRLLGERLGAAGIPLVLVSTPVSPRWRLGQRLGEALERHLAEEARALGQRFMPRAALPQLAAEAFHDRMHMTPIAGAAFTRRLAEVLAVALGS